MTETHRAVTPASARSVSRIGFEAENLPFGLTLESPISSRASTRMRATGDAVWRGGGLAKGLVVEDGRASAAQSRTEVFRHGQDEILSALHTEQGDRQSAQGAGGRPKVQG